MPPYEIGCLALAMNQAASPLFATTYHYDLHFFQVGKFLSIHFYCITDLPVLETIDRAYFFDIDRRKEIGNIEVV